MINYSIPKTILRGVSFKKMFVIINDHHKCFGIQREDNFNILNLVYIFQFIEIKNFIYKYYYFGNSFRLMISYDSLLLIFIKLISILYFVWNVNVDFQFLHFNLLKLNTWTQMIKYCYNIIVLNEIIFTYLYFLYVLTLFCLFTFFKNEYINT